MQRCLDMIAERLGRGAAPGPGLCDKALRARNRERVAAGLAPISKRDVSAYAVAAGADEAVLACVRVKPGRTASGIASVAVMLEPHPCRGGCVFCPDDPAMPKSYLSAEPACRRALECGFDPYAQAAGRIGSLEAMGHTCDKVELLVLGGTFGDYPTSYREEFMRACLLAAAGLPEDDATPLAGLVAANERARRRVVGVTFETRPDDVTHESLAYMRRLGATRVQVGIQSTDYDRLAACGRPLAPGTMERAFFLLRLYGFKIHAHMMANLPGATPEADAADYAAFMTGSCWRPDEVKIYPCQLVAGTPLVAEYEAGRWRPYTQEELVGVLAADLAATPEWVRVSRMVRDICSGDVVAGAARNDLRTVVEGRAGKLREMRSREIRDGAVDPERVRMSETRYDTSVGREVFLQFEQDGKLAAFLRLSLPDAGKVDRCDARQALTLYDGAVGRLPAMIRELHVYGRAAKLGESGRVQHGGLGGRLVARAREIAVGQGYEALAVISAMGTRGYYRRLGFGDAGLYQVVRLG